MNKQHLRQHFIKSRKTLSATERQTETQKILNTIAAWPPCVLGIYMPIQGEMDLTPLTKSHHTLALPIIQADKILAFARYTPPFVAGAYNIPIPTHKEYITPEKVICPCVALHHPTGARLGYGGGYYDRSAAKYPDIEWYGAVFSCQITPQNFAEAHDSCVKYIY